MQPARVSTKICGVSTPEAVRAALDGGAAYLGFVFFPRSPRYLTLPAADRLAEPARGRAKVVALAVDPTDAQLDEIAQGLRPDLIQLHGAETPARARPRTPTGRAELVRGSTGPCCRAAVSSVPTSWPEAWTRGTSARPCASPARRLWTFPLAWSADRA